MLPTMFRFIWQSGFRGENFQKSTNQKQELAVAAIFVNGQGRNEHLYRGPPIDASYQVSVHLAKRFQRRRFFRNQPINNKNCLWRPCLLTNRDEMNNGNRQGSYTFFVRKFHDFSRTFPGFFLVFPGPTLNKMSTSISEILSNHIIYHVLTFVHPKIGPTVRPFDQDGPHSRTQLNIGPYGKFT